MASIFLLAFSLVWLLVILTCTASLLSHDEECLALLEFKQTILDQDYNDAGGFQMLDSWRNITKSNGSDNGSDCCLWDGVVCSNKGHVVGLDLSQSSLHASIKSNSSLFKLIHLQMLNLSMNNFVESQIPSEIARLKHLRSLDLSYSGFSGQIPNELSHLIHLSSLDLSGNPLKLHSSRLEYLLKNMTRLEYLHLYGVDLSSSVPRFLANFSSLKSIRLEDCQLRGEFPSAIFHLPKLKDLNMRNNSNLIGSLPEFHNTTLLKGLSLALTGFSGIIPESISNLNHLTYLDLQVCYFSGHIPGSLPNLTQLTFLALFENDFTGLVPPLARLSKLRTLSLGHNSYEIGNVYDINKLTNLEVLELRGMNIHDEILPRLVNLTKLSVALMKGNSIFGHIPSSLVNLTQLKTLDLRSNQLQGQIPNLFFNFKSLEYLTIGFNNFSGTVTLDFFSGLNKLELLGLDGISVSFVNRFNYTNDTLPELKHLGLSSCNLKEFPAFLQFHMKMSTLGLDDNEIKGLVPNWIWNNSRETLRVISLRGNFITGFQKYPSFLPWICLELLLMANNQLQGQLPIPPQTILVYDVSNNNLTTEIPPWICELKSLQILDLSSNKMTGMLPPCLGNLTNSLSALDLKHNNFHGPMMNACTKQSLLKTIDLSENRFTGQVSKSFANCTNLEFLSLADNSFVDVFPVWLGTLLNLEVLILRSNKFYGGIQGLASISSQFPNLRIIDISNNNFSGQLPDKAFQTWNAMKSIFVGGSYAMEVELPFDNNNEMAFSYSMTLTNKGVKTEYERILSIVTAIDFSCNNFEGQIPQSLKNLHGLESLNLSNNHFTGHIFPALGNLKNLESLDLRQNKLSGQIPQQLLQLDYLAILNVSFNHLDGRIPQGKQFNTFENNSYLGNPGLCGKPLSKECDNSKASTLVQATSRDKCDSLFPCDKIDWIVILFGVGSGLVIGIVTGQFLYARHGDWLLERLGMRKDKWVRPLRNPRRN